VPDGTYGKSWQIVIDTADPLLATPGSDAGVKPGDTIDAPAQTVLVLQNLY
jgi:isoamylase